MLRKYLEDEELKGDNQYFCEKCQRKMELTIKKSKLRRLPPILIVIANRFSSKNKLHNKILDKIQILENFSISEIFTKENFENCEEKPEITENFQEKEENHEEIIEKNEEKLKKN